MEDDRTIQKKNNLLTKKSNKLIQLLKTGEQMKNSPTPSKAWQKTHFVYPLA